METRTRPSEAASAKNCGTHPTHSDAHRNAERRRVCHTSCAHLDGGFEVSSFEFHVSSIALDRIGQGTEPERKSGKCECDEREEVGGGGDVDTNKKERKGKESG